MLINNLFDDFLNLYVQKYLNSICDTYIIIKNSTYDMSISLRLDEHVLFAGEPAKD